MGACPDGAEPGPNATTTQVIISTATLGADVIATITRFWPAALASGVIGMIDINELCESNPDDPGPPQPGDLIMWTASIVPGVQQATGAGTPFTDWVWRQGVYRAFQLNCRCKVTNTAPPPPATVPPPTNITPYPPGPGNQQPGDAQADRMQTLYDGLQTIAASVAQLYFWYSPQVGWATYLQDIEGEGTLDLPRWDVNDYEANITLGVRLNIIPPVPGTTSVHGVVSPRYMKLGSIYWEGGRYQSGPYSWRTARTPVECDNQVILPPRGLFPWRMGYELWPDVRLAVYQLQPNQEDTIFTPPYTQPNSLIQFAGFPFYGPSHFPDDGFSGSTAPSARRLIVPGARLSRGGMPPALEPIAGGSDAPDKPPCPCGKVFEP